MYNVKYKNASSVGPSQQIWADCPVIDMIDDPGIGSHFFDDFVDFGIGTAVASNQARYVSVGGYTSFEGASATILPLNTEINGVVRLTLPNTNSIEASFEGGTGVAGNWKITAGTGPKLWFEARIRLNQILTQDFFVGLAEKGCAVTSGLFSNADALQTKSFLGFRTLAAASSVLGTGVGKNGGAERTSVAAQTMVASTWYKVGFVYDKKNGDGKVLRFFVNGVEVDNLTSDTIATFPTASVLTPFINLKGSAAVSGTPTADMDWWRVAQLR